MSNCRPNLARNTPCAAKLSPHSSAPSPSAAALKRPARPQTNRPPRSNPHSASGAITPSPSAVSSLGGFPTPAAGAPRNAQSRPASERRAQIPIAQAARSRLHPARFPPLEVFRRRPPAHPATLSRGRHPKTFTVPDSCSAVRTIRSPRRQGRATCRARQGQALWRSSG